MRKVQLYVPALAMIGACAIAGCQNTSSSTDPIPPVPATTQPVPAPPSPTYSSSPSPAGATGLYDYVPTGLQSSCTDTGTAGHFPAAIAGYTDSLTCSTGVGSEADYYQFASASDMQSAYSTGSSDYIWGTDAPGGCAAGTDETGTWSTGGSVIGDIACPSGTQQYSLIWDDQNTDVLAVINADYASFDNIYLWWQSNGASIDGSSQGATSS